MVRKNITVTIIQDTLAGEEPLINIKSSDNRSEVLLEAMAAKISVPLEDLHQAILIVTEFSDNNPSPKKEVFIKSSEDEIPIAKFEDMQIGVEHSEDI